MKQLLLLVLLLGTATLSYGQSSQNIDSIVKAICSTFQEEKKETDSLTFLHAVKKHYGIYDHIKVDSDKQNLYVLLNFKLQKSCPGFALLMDKITPFPSEGERITRDLPTMLTDNQCREIFKANHYAYFQGGEKVKVFLTDSTWTSLFPDGTYSELSLEKRNACEFVITFSESNNALIRDFLKKGEKFRYKVLEKFDTYFLLLTEDKQSHLMETFKFYKN